MTLRLEIADKDDDIFSMQYEFLSQDINPERMLLLSILERAFLDLNEHRNFTNNQIYSNSDFESSVYFFFQNKKHIQRKITLYYICEHLNLSIKRVRKQALNKLHERNFDVDRISIVVSSFESDSKIVEVKNNE